MTANSELLVVFAGIPQPIGEGFAKAFARMRKDHPIRRFTWLPLDWSTPYSGAYASTLYDRLADRLARRGEHFPDSLNLVLLYLDKGDGSHRHLMDQFGVEALVMRVPDVPDIPLDAPNRRRRVVNTMIRNLNRTIGPIRSLLNVVGREVTSGDRTTCLLLPPKTFGDRVLTHLQEAVEQGAGHFKEELRKAARSIPRGGKYFQNRRCVFRPAARRARHGMPPSWKENGHLASCVIRGRFRFGVPYDPGFHYDCEIRGGSSRKFPGCHEPVTVSRSRTHVNVAPNDNVRVKNSRTVRRGYR